MRTKNVAVLYRVHRSPIAHLLAAHLTCVEEHQREFSKIRKLFAEMDVLLSDSSVPQRQTQLATRAEQVQKSLVWLRTCLRVCEKLTPELFGTGTHLMTSWNPPKNVPALRWDRRAPLPGTPWPLEMPPSHLLLEASQMESLARSCRGWEESLILCGATLGQVASLLLSSEARKKLSAQLLPMERFAEDAQRKMAAACQDFRDRFWLPEAFDLPWGVRVNE
jgi:hypothetical protein